MGFFFMLTSSFLYQEIRCKSHKTSLNNHHFYSDFSKISSGKNSQNSSTSWKAWSLPWHSRRIRTALNLSLLPLNCSTSNDGGLRLYVCNLELLTVVAPCTGWQGISKHATIISKWIHFEEKILVSSLVFIQVNILIGKTSRLQNNNYTRLRTK